MKRARADYSGVGTREEPNQGDREGGAGEAGGGRNTSGGGGAQREDVTVPRTDFIKILWSSVSHAALRSPAMEMDCSELGKLEVIGNHGGHQ